MMGRTVGVDIGVEALRGVVVEDSKGRLNLVSAGSLPLGELGLMEDSEDKRLAVEGKLKELVQKAKLKGSHRRIAVPDKDAEVRYLLVPPVPPWRLEMLAKYEVEERSTGSDAKTFDYRILDIPDASGQFTVMIGCCTETASQWLLDSAKRAKLGEVEIDLKAVALYNAYYHGHGFDVGKTVMVVDIGADYVTAILVKDGALFLARSFLGGGRRFTQVMADDMRMTPLEADEIKKADAEIRFDIPPSGGSRGTRMFRTGRTAVMRRPNSGRPGGTGIRTVTSSLRAKDAPAKPGDTENKNADTDPNEKLTRVLRRPNLDSLRLQGEEEGGASKDHKPDAPSPSSSSDSVGAKLNDDLKSSPAAPEGTAPAEQSETKTESLSLDELELSKPIAASGLTPDGEVELSPAEQRKRQMSGALVKEAAALCAALENAVSYCRNQNKLKDFKLDTIYLTGAGSRLKGLDQFMTRRMRTPVEKLDVFKNVSLDRLPPGVGDELKADQDTMAVALGLALSGLRKGAFSFLLWPSVVTEQKQFRARGAFLYYAAALFLATVALVWYTPLRNKNVYAGSHEVSSEAIKEGGDQGADLKELIETHKELSKRLEQIERNASSGHYFLRILSALKDNNKNPQYVYLTSISTTEPNVISATGVEEGGSEYEGLTEAEKVKKIASDPNRAPDTFTAQAKVYIRGFVRSGEKERLMEKIFDPETRTGFCNLLVPYPESPDRKENIFKDIFPIMSPDPHQLGQFYVQEFVVIAYVEGTREGDDSAKKNSQDELKKKEGSLKNKSKIGATEKKE